MHILTLGPWLDTWTEQRSGSHPTDMAKAFQTTGRHVSTMHDELTFLPPSDKVCALNNKLPEVLEFLKCNRQPNGHTSDELVLMSPQQCSHVILKVISHSLHLRTDK